MVIVETMEVDVPGGSTAAVEVLWSLQPRRLLQKSPAQLVPQQK